MHKVAIISNKGGVGKTTTALNLAHGLALDGKKVILIDCDPQNNFTDFFALDDQRSLSELLEGKKSYLSKVRNNLYVLPSGGKKLQEAQASMVRMKNPFYVLSERLADLGNCDYAIFDCSGTMSLINSNVLCYADSILIPVAMDYFSLNGLMRTFEQVKELCRTTGENVKIMGILATMFDRRTRVSRHIYSTLTELFPREIFRTMIRINVRLKESPAYGKTVFEYDPFSTGAIDYRCLVDEVKDRAKAMLEPDYTYMEEDAIEYGMPATGTHHRW